MKDESWIARERARMLGEPAHAKAKNNRLDEISVAEAERFFRLDDYIVGEARNRRILQVQNAFHDDPELSPTLVKSAELVRRKN